MKKKKKKRRYTAQKRHVINPKNQYCKTERKKIRFIVYLNRQNCPSSLPSSDSAMSVSEEYLFLSRLAAGLLDEVEAARTLTLCPTVPPSENIRPLKNRDDLKFPLLQSRQEIEQRGEGKEKDKK